MDERTLPKLLAVGRSLAAELDLDRLLERVLEVARELTAARFAAVGVMDESRGSLGRFITSGIDPAVQRAIGDLPRGRGVLGVLFDDPHPLRLSDVSAHPRSYGFPLNHPPMATFLGVPIVIGGQTWGNLYLCEKDGGEFTDADEEAMVVLADWAAIAIGNARLYQSVLDRRDELERAVRALETTTEISRAVGGEIEIDRILELIAKRGRALVEARTMLVALVEGKELRVVAGAGERGAAAIDHRQIAEGTVAGAALRSLSSERFAGRAVGGAVGRLDPPDAQSGLVVPLVFRGTALGVLVAFDRLTHGPGFSAEDERLVQAFAASAATAVATAQQVESHATARSIRASEGERRRWARELHDDTLQELAAMRVRLAAAQRCDTLEASRAIVAEVMTRTTAAVESLRALITELRPAALDDIGAAAAVRELCQRVATSSGLDVATTVDLGDEDGRHTADLEDAVYRIVQEALTNVVKHAGATAVTVDVSSEQGTVEVRIHDDGRGFDVEQPGAGFGLIGMRERVGLVGGQLKVESKPGEGTMIRASLPARRRRDRAQLHAARG
jgi:signal transduction histidine kinase